MRKLYMVDGKGNSFYSTGNNPETRRQSIAEGIAKGYRVCSELEYELVSTLTRLRRRYGRKRVTNELMPLIFKDVKEWMTSKKEVKR